MCNSISKQYSTTLAARQRLYDVFCNVCGFATQWCRYTLFQSNYRADIGQCLNPLRSGQDTGMAQRHCPVHRAFTQNTHLTSNTYRLSNPLGKQWVVFAQIGANHQDALQSRQVSDSHPQESGSFLSNLELGVAKTVIYILTAKTSNQCTRQVQLFQCTVRTYQSTNRCGTMIGFDTLQTMRDILKRGFPIDRLPLPALLQHRRRKTLITIQSLVGESVTVGNPALVNCIVLQCHHSHDAITLNLNDQIRAVRIVGANRLTTRQLPCTGAVPKWLARQCSHRTNVNHVAREFRID